MNQKYKKIIQWTAALFILFIFFNFSLKLKPFIPIFRDLIITQGFLGPAVLILADALSIIISPLTSFPLWLVSLSLFGFIPTFIYVYIGNNIGNMTAFLIAKYYGRPLVERFVGKEKMRKVDEFVDVVGVKPLFIARLFGGAASDYISYAAGLTKIKARTYLLINLFANWPSIFIQLLILERTINVNPVFFLGFVIWGYLTAFGLSVYLYKKNKDRS
jgi:uncharacterized membrane protein YdjX (TVP38/TMEM64 family)